MRWKILQGLHAFPTNKRFVLSCHYTISNKHAKNLFLQGAFTPIYQSLQEKALQKHFKLLYQILLSQGGIQNTSNSTTVVCFNCYLPNFDYWPLITVIKSLHPLSTCLQYFFCNKGRTNQQRSTCCWLQVSHWTCGTAKNFGFSPQLPTFPFKRKEMEQQVYPVPREFNYWDFQQLQRMLD